MVNVQAWLVPPMLLLAVLFDLMAPDLIAGACSDPCRWLLAAVLVTILLSLACEQLPGSTASLRLAGVLLILSATGRRIAVRIHLWQLSRASRALDRYAVATLTGAHPRRRQWSAQQAALLSALSTPIGETLPRLLESALSLSW